jgi:hypothetical protein
MTESYYHNRFRGLLVHEQETAEAVGFSQESITPSNERVDAKHVVSVATSATR